MKRKYKSKKVVETYDHLPPPRSDKYGLFGVALEQNIKKGDNNYLMRVLENGAVELVRYDCDINKWMVLCFSGIEEKPNIQQAV